MHIKKVAITGASGFIGTHLVQRLNRFGNLNINVFDHKKHYLFNKKTLVKVVDSCDTLYHLAGICNPEDINSFKVNVLGTQNLLQVLSEKSPNCHLVFASTFGVYKPHLKQEFIKENNEIGPDNDYGLTKYLAEELIENYSKNCGLKATILRMSNIYGPGMKPFRHSVIATAFEQILNKEKLMITGDGEQTRDFIYVEDVVDALLLAVKQRERFNTFNICSGKPVSINDLIGLIEKCVGRKAEIEYIQEKRKKSNWCGSYEYAKNMLSWEPKTDLIDGLQKEYENLMKPSNTR